MNEKKCLIILFKNHIFYCFFLFVIAKVCIFCCRRIGTAFDSNDLAVFSPTHCQVTARNYIFRIYVVYTKFLVSIDKSTS